KETAEIDQAVAIDELSGEIIMHCPQPLGLAMHGGDSPDAASLSQDGEFVLFGHGDGIFRCWLSESLRSTVAVGGRSTEMEMTDDRNCVSLLSSSTPPHASSGIWPNEKARQKPDGQSRKPLT